MSNANNSEPERPAQGQLGAFPYVLGGLSFIPAIGVVFGISAVTWGLVTRKSGGRRVACIGFAGIAFTVILYTALFYFGFVQRGGVYDDLRSKMSQSTLSSVVPVIEMYKLQSGHYPESMAALKGSIPKDSPVFLFDPATMRLGQAPSYFFYQRVGEDHYYLRGVGPDGLPFTADDIVPQVQVTAGSKIGLLVDRVPGS
ncbi:MAG: type II secretion system protein G [Caulobacter sp.]|nr:type II secretion system protein G [Vitreoscilla sp.]